VKSNPPLRWSSGGVTQLACAIARQALRPRNRIVMRVGPTVRMGEGLWMLPYPCASLPT
jgi:hypothetical protein